MSNADHNSREVKLVLVSAGTGEPSSTRLLADRIAAKLSDVLVDAGTQPSLAAIELAPLSADIAGAIVGGVTSDRLTATMTHLADADIVVVSTPVYKAGLSGLFKSYVDVLDDDLLVGKPVVLAATAGSPRHAMVVDDHLRPLFAYMRAVTVPTSLFAAPEDWADPALNRRIERTAVEADVLLHAQAEIKRRIWSSYEHQIDSRLSPGRQAKDILDFDTPLMRLAAGGATPSRGSERLEVDQGPTTNSR
jgi:FMN reductase